MIIGVIGYIGSGKNASADILVNQFGFKKESFAKSLKDAAAIIFGWDRQMLEGDTPESRLWREQEDKYWSKQLGWTVTPRAVLQKLGTEAGREVFGYSLWTASTMRRMEQDPGDYVITDVRFPNEAEALKAAGGLLVRVTRDTPQWADHLKNVMQTMYIDVPEWMEHFYPDVHASEWNIALLDHDVEVFNDGSLQDLEEKILEILDRPQ